MNDRIAVYCGTRNLYHEMEVSAKSLIYHNGADHIYFMIEDDCFPSPLPECITTINVSNQPYFREDGPNFRQYCTYMALIRAAFTKYFPQYDRVLSLDCDTIVNGDISLIWNTDLTGKYYAGVREVIAGHEHDPPYCNFGVILMNLAQLRDGTDDIIIQLLNEKPYGWPEQNAFNEACFGQYVHLPEEYNVTYYSKPYLPYKTARIMHFSNDKKAENMFAFRKFARKSWAECIERGSRA